MVMETHKKLSLEIILGVGLILTACTNAANEHEPKASNLETPKFRVCSDASLVSTSNAFLGSLKAENLSSAISFYQNASYLDEKDHDAAYTFFPKYNKNSIFDFKKTNTVSEFETEIFGEYSHNNDKGMLVLFVQQAYKDKIRDVKFLSETKFANHFTCYFECVDETWKITGYGCFEDSGGPFFPICEEGETDEYCP